MQVRLTASIFLLIVCVTAVVCIPSAFSSQFIDSWAEIEVLSFNGENIFMKLRIFVLGKHTNQKMWITSEFPSTSGPVHVQVSRAICDVIFNEGTNVTIFSYAYSVNHTYYEARPKIFGYLLFPWDYHKLLLFISPSFNLTMDSHQWSCELPSQNYEGRFQVTHAPTSDDPSRYKLVLEIKHSEKFSWGVGLLVGGIITATYALSIILTTILGLIAYREKSYDLIKTLVRISSAIIFFVPAFEIAFYTLKSPLPLVFFDMLLIFTVPWNIAIIVFGVFFLYSRSENK